MEYSPAYWDDYYGGSYEETFHYGFPLARIIDKEWDRVYRGELPQSFADIGCGLGHTLLTAKKIFSKDAVVYGVESQPIPKERMVSSDIYFGDFMDIYSQLPAVDFLYVACSMYIPWERQPEFLSAVTSLSKKALVFANIYLEDGGAIPNDILRTSIYRNRKDFRKAVEAFGFVFKGSRNIDFFVPAAS